MPVCPPELLRKFRKQHPEIKVDVLVQGHELADALEQDKIQLAIVDEACGHRFHWTPLTDAPLVAVVPPDFPWQDETISLERLLQDPDKLADDLLLLTKALQNLSDDLRRGSKADGKGEVDA